MIRKGSEDILNEVGETNQKLDILGGLARFNDSLRIKYKDEVLSAQFEVFTAEQYSSVLKSPELSYVDEEFLTRLGELDFDDRAIVAASAIDYLRNSQDYDLELGKRPLEPQSTRAKLRRTAAVLFKTAIIPEQELQIGSFKNVVGPMGIKSDDELNMDIAFVSALGRLWRWDGNFKREVTKERISSIQLAKVMPRRFDIEGTDYNTAQLKLEFDFLSDLKARLGSENSKCLPKIGVQGKVSKFVEYLPQPYVHTKLTESLESAEKLSRAVELLWKKGGVVNVDLKPDNLRRRENGDVIIVDWGSYVLLHPGEDRFDGEQVGSVTPAYLSPELVRGDDDVEVEKLLVHQLATVLLVDLFPEDSIAEVLLTRRIGYSWKTPGTDYITRNSYDISVNSKTFEALCTMHPEIQLPPKLQKTISRSLADNSSDRPTLAAFRNALSEGLK